MTGKQAALIILSLLGTAKLILQASGYDILTDDQINAIANGVAGLFDAAGTAYAVWKHWEQTRKTKTPSV